MLCDNCGNHITTHKGMPPMRYGEKNFCTSTCLVKYVRYKREQAEWRGGTS